MTLRTKTRRLWGMVGSVHNGDALCTAHHLHERPPTNRHPNQKNVRIHANLGGSFGRKPIIRYGTGVACSRSNT